MRWLASLALLGVLACGAAEDEPIAGDDDVIDDDDDAAAPPARDGGATRDARPPPAADAAAETGPPPGCARADWGPARTFQLAHGAFPDSGHPDAAVYVPAGYDPCKAQGAVVFFHGFKNCVANVIGNEPTVCTEGQPPRTAFGLSDLLQASDANAILIAVELKYDQATGAPGALANEAGLYDLLEELYGEQLSPWLEHEVHVNDLDRVVLTSHSGGYTALARGLDRGGLVNVSEVDLFDSLYGETDVYEGWILDQLPQFDVDATDPRRFAVVYTSGGGTLDNSEALAEEVRAQLDSEDRLDAILYDPSTATLDDSAFAAPLVFKHSALSHDGTVSYYFGRFLAQAGFPQR